MTKPQLLQDNENFKENTKNLKVTQIEPASESPFSVAREDVLGCQIVLDSANKFLFDQSEVEISPCRAFSISSFASWNTLL